jgi:hypothetical protein
MVAVGYYGLKFSVADNLKIYMVAVGYYGLKFSVSLIKQV